MSRASDFESERKRYEGDARSIVGCRLARVAYLTLETETDSSFWDHGDFHVPVFGVELEDAEGASFTVTWTWVFHAHEIRLVPGTVDLQHASRIPLSKHDRWKDLLGLDVTDVSVHWTGVDSDSSERNDLYPQSLSITLDQGRKLYFTAAYVGPDGSLEPYAGDEVGVVFTESLAHRLGLGPFERLRAE